MTKKISNGFMKFIGQVWAITGDALDMLAGVLVKMDFEALGQRDKNREPVAVDVRSGIAVVDITGALAKDYGFEGWWSSTSGYLGIREQVERALLMPNVKAILLNVDSPGGTVDGCKECADFLRAAAAKKPIYTYANGTMASAAYWIGSVGRVIAAPSTASVGSIGVRTMHADWSKYDEKTGIKYTYVVSGKYKAVPNPDEPLEGENLAYVQGLIDDTYAIFAADVAENRGLGVEKITALEGKVLLAGPAVEAGLIDRIESDIHTFIETIKREEDSLMDYATLKASHPDLFDKIKSEGVTEGKGSIDVKGQVDAAVASVIGLVNVIVGEEMSAKVEALVKAGVSAEQAVAIKGALGVSEPEKKQDADPKKAILDALKTAAQPPASGDGQQVDASGAGFEALVEAHMATAGATKGKAMMDMRAKHPQVYDAWIKGQQK